MISLDKENFEHEVLEADEVVLVDFWSPTCGTCKALMPHIHKLEEKYGDKIKFASLDTSKARRLAISQKIMGLPVVAIYKGGEKIDAVVAGDANPKSVEDLIKKYI